MANINKNDLGFLGETFQYRLAHEFMENHTFFEDLSPIVNQNMFTDPNLKTLVGVIKNFYEREGNVPSYDSLEIELRNLSHSDRETETYVAILNRVKEVTSEGADRTKELAERFFRQQNIIKTANEILHIAGTGNIERYDECVSLLNDAMTKGIHNDFGEGIFDHLNETLSDDYRVPIPTGISKIDEVLEGGLGKGELGVIIGPSGFGKVQPNDANIVTPTGFRKMGEIKVGDYVIGRNGRPTKVIGVFPHKDWQFYKVTFSDGASTECGKEHLWNITDEKKWDEEHEDWLYKTMPLEEIMSCDYSDFHLPELTNAVEFDNQDTEEKPYDFGKKIAQRECASKIPNEYLYNSSSKRHNLLKGITDTMAKKYPHSKYKVRNFSKDFIEDVKFLYMSFGISCEVLYDESKGDWIVETSSYFRYFSSIEKSRICDGQCIKVEAEDELYLTDDFIVTHNTSMTTAMGAYAAQHGFKVLQIVFEDRIKQIQRKHLGRITGVESKNLSKPEYLDKVKETLSKFEDKETMAQNLRIIRFPSGEKTATFIENFIKKISNSGFKPDLVIVDYFECLKHDASSKESNEFEREGKTMRKFEAMAGELDVAMWIPSQGTKDSINLELVTMDKVGGSVKKVQIAHVVMSIARSIEDISEGKATIAILKNRAGGSGKVFDNVDFNNGTCRISTDNVDEMDSLYGMKQKMDDEKLKLQREIVMASAKRNEM